MTQLKYSVIVPVFNRPQEVQELLQSLVNQKRNDLEVIIVEDGSSVRCDTVVDTFRSNLPINYIYKPNSGPGPSRNVGFQNAKGDYFVVFDSDCILPPGYFDAVDNALREFKLDAWGGPDRAHQDFSIVQRAMAYTMSSVLTTGGIRGGKQHVGWFQPRSFNMGISRKVFEATGGFHFDRYAEDIEFSIRMKNRGFRVGLIPEAFVYHKRRTSFNQFYHQVYNFGRGRVLVGRKYPSEVKLTHWFPSLFVLGTMLIFLTLFINLKLFLILFAGFLFYLFAIFLHSFVANKSASVAILSIPSALLQFFGYGIGFLTEKMKK